VDATSRRLNAWRRNSITGSPLRLLTSSMPIPWTTFAANVRSSSTVLDRVAQAAFSRRCHYVDAAGMSFVKERMLPHHREIEDLGLSFVVSAGWMPGMSELLPAYADAKARAGMDTIES